MSTPLDWPIAIRHVELTEPLQAIADVAGYPRTRIFVFDAGILIGSA